MKNVFILLISALCSITYAQNIPNKPVNKFDFPIGSKFTIKLVPKDANNFDYSVIAIEPFKEVVDLFDNDHLFEEQGDENTITFYFCLATRGETQEEKDKI